jgi:hypothetical protein
VRRAVLCALSVLPGLGRSGPAWALSLDDLSGADTAAGLRQALTQGATRAVDLLGRPDGFLGDPRVRIPLPDSLKTVERLMRAMGQGARFDELVVAMNRAAEAAVPQARTLLVDAVKQMSIADAKAIVTGGDDAATRYFRSKTGAEIARRLQPVVKRATDRLQLARQYDGLAAQGAQLGLVKPGDETIDGYVTRKALDGLFLAIADEERAIRANPAAAAGSLARRVFGAAGR